MYINGIANISIQDTLGKKSFPETFATYNENHIRCIDPVFKEYLNPMQSRRMGRLVKRSIITTKECLKDAGLEQVDAIISGTGLGLIENTEVFLTKMINDKEQFLQPTYFIQSTHNTISSQIAINLKCHGYNNTYVHRGFSFESTLLDAKLQMAKDMISNALVGGHDELTPAIYEFFNKANYWKKEKCSNLDLLQSKSAGSIAGEGSSSFLLANKKTENTYAKIEALDFIYKPDSSDEVNESVVNFLQRNELKASDIDIVILGNNGDTQFDYYYNDLANKIFPNTTQAHFKHLCGEYYTSSAFALWMGALALKNKSLPSYAIHKNADKVQYRNILIYNHFRGNNHSLILLKDA